MSRRTLAGGTDDLPEDVSAWDIDAAAADGGPATDPAPTPLVSFALRYAARGWRVLPIYPPNDDGACACGDPACLSPAKHPIPALAPHGLHDATTDPATIRQHWAVWPDANIGVRTGAASGLIVEDIDAKHGGWESSARLEAAQGSWPDSPTVATGGGGAHLYLRHPGGTIRNNTTGLIALGVDLKADGGYVLAPPSRHASGNVYRWAPGFRPDDVPLADVPDWLLALVTPPADTRGTPTARLADDEPIAEGGRNDRLMRLGAAFRRYGLTEGEILAALQTVNAARCRPPLDPAEVARIAHSVVRYLPARGGATLHVGRPRVRGGNCLRVREVHRA